MTQQQEQGCGTRGVVQLEVWEGSASSAVIGGLGACVILVGGRKSWVKRVEQCLKYLTYKIYIYNRVGFNIFDKTSALVL